MNMEQNGFRRACARVFHVVGALLVTISAVHAAPLVQGQEIALWGDRAAPGSEGLVMPATTPPTADAPWPDAIGILRPTLTAFVPAKATGTVVIVIPGGGYTKLVMGKEGADIATWLNSIGVTAFVLKHRLPGEGHANPADVPLQDVQRAVRLVRSHAAEWGLAPQKIGVMGFSAGGHLAAISGTSFDTKVYERVDAIDDQSARPDFAALVYGVLSVNFGVPVAKLPLILTHYQPDMLVTAQTPPVFMAAANDDVRVDPSTNADFYRALRRAGVSAELHVFREGTHGFAISRAVGKPVALWTRLCAEWMNSIGMPVL
jgi:acetyl esterase/lipase